MRYELEEINDYMTNWIHEVKIPISVLEIIGRRVSEIDGGKSLSKEIKTEVSRIDKLVGKRCIQVELGIIIQTF